MSTKRTLVIDGNYMLKRFLRDYDFVADPQSDRNNFLIDLSQHIACEIERIQGFCDNIIMCKDSHSWRKDVPIVKPLKYEDSWLDTLVSSEDVTNYKSNRKQAEDRNWELIYSAFSEFCDCLNRDFDVPFVQCYGAEGDDCIWATTTYLRQNKIKSCVYCTDSDINQLVTPSNVILRRVKSKAAPEGEIVVHPAYWKLFSESTTQTNNPLALFEYDITEWAPDMEMFKNRSLGNGISITLPYWFVLVHMIVGSTKDNVPELFTWPAKSVTRHIQTKHIECALALCNMTRDQVREQHLYDEPFLKALIINLCHVTGQPQFITHLEHLYKMLECNRKLNYLSEKEIPDFVQSALFDIIKIQSNTKADMKSLSNANNIMERLHVSKDKTFQMLGI